MRHRDKRDHRRRPARRTAVYTSDEWSQTSSDDSDYEVLPILDRKGNAWSSSDRPPRREGLLAPMEWAGEAILKGLDKLVGSDSDKVRRTRHRGKSYQRSHRQPTRDIQVVRRSYTTDRKPRELDISPEHGDRQVIATFDKRHPGRGYMTSSKRHGKKRKVYYDDEGSTIVRRQPIRTHRIHLQPTTKRLTQRDDRYDWPESDVSVRSAPAHTIQFKGSRRRHSDHEDEYEKTVQQAPRRREASRKAHRSASASSSDEDDSSAASHITPAGTESLKNAFKEQGRALRHSRLSPRQLKLKRLKAEKAKRLKEEEAARQRAEAQRIENERLRQEQLARQAEEQRQRQAAERQHQQNLRRQEEERQRAEQARNDRIMEEMRRDVPFGRGIGPPGPKYDQPQMGYYWSPDHNEPRLLPYQAQMSHWPENNAQGCPPPGHFWDLDRPLKARPLPMGFGAGVYWPWAAPTRLRKLVPAPQIPPPPQVNCYWQNGQEIPN